MKYTHLPLTVLITLCLFFFVSCDNDKVSPIKLKDFDESVLRLSYPDDGQYTYTVEGGNGEYTASSQDPDVVSARMVKSDLQLIVKGLGKTKVVVTDESDNSFSVDVHVDYYMLQMRVSKLQVHITGEIEEADKKVLTEKALATFPIAVGGGWQFVFMDKERISGEVYMIQPDTTDSRALKSDFTVRVLKEGDPGSEYGRYIYDLTIDGKERSFIWTTQQYLSTRLSVVAPVLFVEDMTEQFKEEYPGVKEVLTVQTLQL